MRFPFLSRAHHQDVVDGLREKIAERDARLVQLDHDHKRLIDSIFKTNFGTQVYGTLQELMPAEEPEANETEREQQEREFQELHQDDVARAKHLMRTSPSKLGPFLEEVRRRDMAVAATPAKIG